MMDLALQVTKVTARSLGQTISTLVVQERHLWLNLADIRESDKQRFLDSPISKAGLFGHTVESLAQFSTAQKLTMIRQQSLPRRPAAVTTPPPAAARSSLEGALLLPPSPIQRGPAAALIPAAAWSGQQGSGTAHLCPCQAHETPEQAAFMGRANPRHWILLFRRW